MLSIIDQPAAINPAIELALQAIFANMNANTLRAYSKSFADFGAFIGSETAGETARKFFAMSEGEANLTIMRYMNKLNETLSPASVSTRLGAIAGIVKRGKIVGLVPWEISVNAPAPKAYRDTRGPGSDAINAMLDTLRERAKLGSRVAIRNIAIIELLFNPALRRSEVTKLDLDDVDVDGQRLNIRGKGRITDQWVTLPEPTMAAIQDWIKIRGGEPGALFTALDPISFGHRLTGEAVRQAVRDIGAVVGVTTRPHALRHSGITTALMATDNNLAATATFARHRNVNTTMTYLDNLQDSAGDTARKLAAMTRRAI